jgi:hypothetical protein
LLLDFFMAPRREVVVVVGGWVQGCRHIRMLGLVEGIHLILSLGLVVSAARWRDVPFKREEESREETSLIR